MIAAIELLRILVGHATATGLSELLVLPVAVVGIDRGIWGGAMAAVAAYALFLLWVLTGQVTGVEAAGHLTRGCLFLLTGITTGWSAEQLRAGRARQNQLADALGDMVCVLDAEARYVYVSGAARELLGHEPAEMVGSSIYDYLHPDDARAVAADLPVPGEGPRPAPPRVHRMCRADGRFSWLETVTRVHHVRGEAVELLCSSRDVTQREVARLASEEDEQELRRQVQQVLHNRGIEPVFQRVVDLPTGRTVGYEALARFPGNAERPADVWFEQAARVGLGEELELLAIESALERLGCLPDGHWLSVNASPGTLAAPRLLDVIRTVPPDRLIVELTEHAEISDYRSFNAGTAALRELGVRLAVDDAGAGFASLRHIVDIRPDVIKLDMTLTRHIDRDPARQALAAALCGFATTLEATVIAEGIEERGELDELLGLGVGQGQGYLLGRPERLPTPLPS